MKYIYLCLSMLVFIGTGWAQAPQQMSYQAVLRDANDELITNAPVSMRISILQGNVIGTAVYTETQQTNTNANGLATIEVGAGTVVTGSFNTIDWSQGPYFIKTETDPSGGTNYSITGTQQLLSVPFALYAATAGNGTAGPKGDKGDQGDKGDKGDKGDPGSAGSGTVYSVGDTLKGGIVFYVYDGGRHGLIAALADHDSSVMWKNPASTTPNTFPWVASFANGIEAGRANTAQIIATHTATQSLGDKQMNAARACNEYAVTWKGVTYSGWYLPSLHELQLLYTNRSVVGGFQTSSVTTDIYCSSTAMPDNQFNIRTVNFADNGSASQTGTGKNFKCRVRPICSF